jgi:hypothetical protein
VFEDGTTGRPLGDDEDLDRAAYTVELDEADRWADMSAAEKTVAILRSLR